MGRGGDFIDVHITRAQKVVALIVGLAAIVGIVAGGVTWIIRDDSKTPPVAAAVSAPATSPAIQAKSPAHPDGWGPDRKTFTLAKPASYAVLNSFTDNPVWGDERNFTRVRDLTPGDKYEDIVRASIGDTVQVVVIVSNNCADNLASSAATIHGLWMQLDNDVVGNDIWFQVHVGGDNVSTVYDGATVITNEPARLRVVADSVRMSTGATQGNGFPVSADTLAAGEHTILGESAADGEFPIGAPVLDGMQRGTGFAEFEMRVVAP